MNKHLIYHIYPHADRKILYENLSYIGSFDHIFDKKIYKVAYDDITSASLILRSFNRDLQYIENNKSLGETVGFIKFLEQILNEDPDGITFVGTTAGVSKPIHEQENVKAWARAIYMLCLANPTHIEKIFSSGDYDAVGCFKKTVPMEKGGPKPAPWHFSGGQFWISNRALLRTNWKDIAVCRHGVEMYPGYMIDVNRAYNLFDTDMNLYNELLPTEDWVKTL